MGIDVSYVSRRGNKHVYTYTAICSVPGKAKMRMLKEPHPSKPVQCFRCQSWHHTTHTCSSNRTTCRKCAGAHRSSECRSNRVKCANCGKAHYASAIVCKYHPRWSQHQERRSTTKRKGQRAESKKSEKEARTRGSSSLPARKTGKPGRVKDSRPLPAPNKPTIAKRRRARKKRTQQWQKKRLQHKSTQTVHTHTLTQSLQDEWASPEQVATVVARALGSKQQEQALHYIRDALYREGYQRAAGKATSELRNVLPKR